MNSPVIVGTGFTVIVAELSQPFASVKVMVVVPAATPVTNPVLLTVATPVSDEVQGVFGAGSPVRVN